MKDEDRNRLTEFLGKCWHEIERPESEPTVFHQPCLHCGRTIYVIRDKPFDQSYAFATQADMMALYKRLHEIEQFEDFYRFAFSNFKLMVMRIRNAIRGQMMSAIDSPIEIQILPWLFCLSGEGYEERCQMVNDFLEAADETGKT